MELYSLYATFSSPSDQLPEGLLAALQEQGWNIGNFAVHGTHPVMSGLSVTRNDTPNRTPASLPGVDNVKIIKGFLGREQELFYEYSV